MLVIPSVVAFINKININYLFTIFVSVVLFLNLNNSYGSQTLSLEKFNTLYEKEYKANINPNWLEWFIGFSEGDGYLGTTDGKLIFVLTQKESKILYHVKDTLKFGFIQNFDEFSRYVVTNQKDIFLLMNLFNGNLHLPLKIDQLLKWGDWWNAKFPQNLISILKIPVELSFNNGWFSGFIDAEGCFNIYFPKKSLFSVAMRFVIDQKNGELLFKTLKNILGTGSIFFRKNNNTRYSVTSLTSLGLLINYLTQFPLKTKKQKAFIKWVNIYNMVLKKQHKNAKSFIEIKRLSVEINKDNDNN